MRQCLILIDMQNDFITGSLGSTEAVDIVRPVIEKVKNYGDSIIFTRDTHDENYSNTQEGRNLSVQHCIKGTDGWQLEKKLDEIAKERNCLIFDKPAFGSLKLGEYLKQEDGKEHIKCIELAGVCTDICVISNAMILKSFLPETEIVVDAECCAGVTRESHYNALEAMKMCQIKIKGQKGKENEKVY